MLFAVRDEKHEFLETTRNGDRFVFLHEGIVNRTNFVDSNIHGVVINKIFALRKNVKVYQWVEERRLSKGGTSYVYRYRRQWSDKLVNSDIFQDRSKSNHVDDLVNLKLYKNENLFVKNIITESGFEIDKKYFTDQIEYRKVLFGNPKAIYRGKVIRRKNRPKSEIKSNYVDLDSYVSDSGVNGRTMADGYQDDFRVIDGYILYNGKDFLNPEIGDVKIEYEVFSPNKISFFGAIRNNRLIPYRNLLEIDSYITERDKFLSKCRVNIIIRLIVIFLLLMIMVDLMFKIIQENLRIYFLHIIPFFGNYFLFGRRKYISPAIVLVLFCIALDFHILSLGSMLLLFILGHKFNRARVVNS
jgi:hypothetical protein